MKRRGFTLAEAFLIGQPGLDDNTTSPWRSLLPMWDTIQTEVEPLQGEPFCRPN